MQNGNRHHPGGRPHHQLRARVDPPEDRRRFQALPQRFGVDLQSARSGSRPAGSQAGVSHHRRPVVQVDAALQPMPLVLLGLLVVPAASPRLAGALIGPVAAPTAPTGDGHDAAAPCAAACDVLRRAQPAGASQIPSSWQSPPVARIGKRRSFTRCDRRSIDCRTSPSSRLSHV